MEPKKRDINEIRAHMSDNADISEILGFSSSAFNRMKRDVIDSYKDLFDDCNSAVEASLYLLTKVLKVENPDADAIARAACFNELIIVAATVQAKAIMAQVQHILHTHRNLSGIALSPARTLFDAPKLLVVQECDGEEDSCEPEPEQREDADRLSYIR